MPRTLKQLANLSSEEARVLARSSPCSAEDNIRKRLQALERKLNLSKTEILRLSENAYSDDVKLWLKLYSALRALKNPRG